MNPYRIDYLADTIRFSGISAEKANINKYKKYEKDIENVSWKFQPLAFERTGGWSYPAQLYVKHIANLLSIKHKVHISVVLNSLVTEISSILMKSVANMVIKRKVDCGPAWVE